MELTFNKNLNVGQKLLIYRLLYIRGAY